MPLSTSIFERILPNSSYFIKSLFYFLTLTASINGNIEDISIIADNDTNNTANNAINGGNNGINSSSNGTNITIIVDNASITGINRAIFDVATNNNINSSNISISAAIIASDNAIIGVNIDDNGII